MRLFTLWSKRLWLTSAWTFLKQIRKILICESLPPKKTSSVFPKEKHATFKCRRTLEKHHWHSLDFREILSTNSLRYSKKWWALGESFAGHELWDRVFYPNWHNYSCVGCATYDQALLWGRNLPFLLNFRCKGNTEVSDSIHLFLSSTSLLLQIRRVVLNDPRRRPPQSHHNPRSVLL